MNSIKALIAAIKALVQKLLNILGKLFQQNNAPLGENGGQGIKSIAVKKMGTFEGTKAGLQDDLKPNQIDFHFKLNPPGVSDDPCDDFCLVSIFHITDADGNLVKPPSSAMCKDPGLSMPPRDEDAADGYIVDVEPVVDFFGGDMSLRKKPCCATTSIDLASREVTATDIPHFLRAGYTAHFVTIVLCIRGKTYEIIGCMKWTNRSEKSPDPAGRHITEIEKDKDGAIDQSEVSGEDIAALDRWISKHGTSWTLHKL